MKPVLHQGNVLYSMLFYVDGFEFLRMVKAQNGEPVWAWNPEKPGETVGRVSRMVNGDLLALTHWNTYYGIDLHTGLNKWVAPVGTDFATGSPELRIIVEYLYTEHSARLTLDTLSYFTRGHLSNGRWDTLFSMSAQEGYRPHLFPPALWLSPTGDSILIFQNRQWNFSKSDGRVDLLAFLKEKK